MGGRGREGGAPFVARTGGTRHSRLLQLWENPAPFFDVPVLPCQVPPAPGTSITYSPGSPSSPGREKTSKPPATPCPRSFEGRGVGRVVVVVRDREDIAV